MTTDDLENRAGKGLEDDRPEMEGDEHDPDPSDYADPRVAQPGQDPPGEEALASGDHERD